MDERVPGESIHAGIMQSILRDHPDFDESKNLSLSELNVYRERYVTDYLDREVGELTDLEKKVVASMNSRSIVCSPIRGGNEPRPTIGVRLSDRMTRFGGSWAFVVVFGSLIVVWMAVNIFWLSNSALDPYPFVLLNLLLTYLSTLQAPLIMMSQNRQADKDRQRSKNDYMVDLKSEIDLRTLHEKLDHLMMSQLQRVIEIQRMQIDMLGDVQRQVSKEKEETESRK